MLNARFDIGQKVRIVTLIDGFGRPDPRIKEWVGKRGEVVKSYYVSGDEVWEKTLKLEDTYCYDIRLDGGRDVARGIPEVSIELFIH